MTPNFFAYSINTSASVLALAASLDTSGKLLYAYITYILFNIFYSVINVPYSSVLASMSNDYQVRNY
ncbi:MFS transporter [Fictibacillus enclensis]|uniref:MFS transporter n=1 Tax=Fictibacillus enclensis TaxID=1017270 RepID=UPI0025A163DC|nr:MFS transporter [Fictibacillus enclensis]